MKAAARESASKTDRPSSSDAAAAVDSAVGSSTAPGTDSSTEPGSTPSFSAARSWNRDAGRGVAVTLAVLACAAASAVLALQPDLVRASALLHPGANLLAPATPAVLLWPVIVLGLAGYAVRQWLPSQRHSERQRHLGWPVAAAAALATLWLLTAVGPRPSALPVLTALALAAVLLWAHRRLDRHPADTGAGATLADATLGLLLGWSMTMAVVAAAALLGGPAGGESGVGWAVTGLILLALALAAVCMTDGGRMAAAGAAAWILAWVLVARLWGEPASGVVASGAGLAAFLVLVAAGSRRHQVNLEARRAQRIAAGYAVDPPRAQ